MYVACVDRTRFLDEVREHKRVLRVSTLPYVSRDGKKRGLQLHYEVAARMRDEKIVITHDEILLAKVVEDDRRIEPRWEVDFTGSILRVLQTENLEYEVR